MPAGLGTPGRARLRGKCIDEPPAGIVPRARIVGAGIAEADDELERNAGTGTAHSACACPDRRRLLLVLLGGRCLGSGRLGGRCLGLVLLAGLLLLRLLL